MPYEHIVAQVKYRLGLRPVALGEKHNKNDARVPARQVVLQLIETGHVRKLFIEMAEQELGPGVTVGKYLREWAGAGKVGDEWAMIKMLFEYEHYQGPRSAFIKAAVEAGVMIYLSDFPYGLTKPKKKLGLKSKREKESKELEKAPGTLEDRVRSGEVSGESDEGMIVRNKHWAQIFNQYTQNDRAGAVILVGAEHFRWLGDEKPLNLLCNINESNTFDLSDEPIEAEEKLPAPL